VIRAELDVRTPDGVAHAWTYRSDDRARAGVLFFVDAYGVRAATQAMAERLAGLGYVVMIPNLFYRAGDFPKFYVHAVAADPAERERLMAMIKSLTYDRMRSDAGAYLETLAAQPGVRAERLGITGYCMGGRMAFLAAAHHPEKVRAAASFHGGGFVTDQPDSPHLLAAQVKASLFFGVADQDRGCSPEHQGVLARVLAEADVDYRMELFRGKKHGFAVTDHAGAYDEEAGARHWRRLESFFAETLA